MKVGKLMILLFLYRLFLGTEKYPVENDFETFVGKNGGSTNAYTDMEDTNYYFSVAPLDHDDIDDDEEGMFEDEGEDDFDEEEYEEESEKVSQALSGGLDRFVSVRLLNYNKSYDHYIAYF